MAKFISQLRKDMRFHASGSFYDGKYTILLNYGVPSSIERNKER